MEAELIRTLKKSASHLNTLTVKVYMQKKLTEMKKRCSNIQDKTGR